MTSVLHYGIAGNANPQLQIGDVTIPQFWAHTGLWSWQVKEFLQNSITQQNKRYLAHTVRNKKKI